MDPSPINLSWSVILKYSVQTFHRFWQLGAVCALVSVSLRLCVFWGCGCVCVHMRHAGAGGRGSYQDLAGLQGNVGVIVPVGLCKRVPQHPGCLVILLHEPVSFSFISH